MIYMFSLFFRFCYLLNKVDKILIPFDGTVDFSCEITISSSFTAECAENAEVSENPNVDWNTLKLCALGDLRGDK